MSRAPSIHLSRIAARAAALGRRLASGALLSARAVKDGADQLFAWDLKLPPEASRARRLMHGLWLPVVVIRVVLSDRDARRRWLKISSVQTAVTVLLAVLFVVVFRPSGDSGEPRDVEEGAAMALEAVRTAVDDRADQLREQARTETEAELVEEEAEAIDDRLRASRDALEERLRTSQATPEEEIRALVQVAVAEVDLAREAASRAQARVERARAEADQLRQKLREEVREKLAEAERQLEGAEEATVPDAVRRLRRALQQASQAPPQTEAFSPARIRDELRKAAAKAAARTESRLADLRTRADRFLALALPVRLLLFLAAVWSALYAVQFIVITLSRDFHDLVSRDACLLTGLEPEDPAIVPRVRLNWKWTKKRIRRRWRAVKLFALGVPLIYVVTIPVPESVQNVLLFLWGAYWLVVFAAAKSARAWVDEGLAPPPWFVRGWTRLTTRVWGFRWWLPRSFGRLWERHSRELSAPAECVEIQPWSFFGLMVFRSISMVPILKLFLRPFIPVASAHLLEAYREHSPARAGKPAPAAAVVELPPAPVAEPTPAVRPTGS